jgi:ankyrin repeat protein
MVRNSRTKSLVNAFQNHLVTCNDVIVATSGHTIVHESIIHSRREYFKLCEVYGADWNKPDLNGVTPLMKAVALNRVYFVERLL